MKILDIDKNDDIYLELRKSYTKEWDSLKTLTLDDLIENVNFINNNENKVLDVSLVADMFIRVFDKTARETVADYNVVYDLGNSVMSYLWSKI